jgi:hypothetical protein
MELSEKKVKLTDLELRTIRESALYNIKNLALRPGMDPDAFVSFCWTKAALGFFTGNNIIDLDVIK